MSEPRTVAVVGAGLAGGKTVEALRAEGYDGRIILFGDELHRPYERPPLSKGYLQGNDARGSVFVHPEGWYTEHDVDLRLGVEVTGLDRHAHELMTHDGEPVRYDRLVLATGRDAAPAAAARRRSAGRRTTCARSTTATRCAPCSARDERGGGRRGMDRPRDRGGRPGAGATVTVLESAELPLLRVLGPRMAQVFADLHRENGVDLRLGASVSVVPRGPVRRDAVSSSATAAWSRRTRWWSGSGSARTSTSPARQACRGDGVLVDANLRSSDPRIFAVGDVANAQHPVLGRRIRVEHWANALHQPEVVATSVLGRDAVYDRLPYFFTDQYDLGMEYVGYADAGYDEVVVRGDLDAREFVALWVRDGRVVAGMNVNVWDVTDRIRDIILAGQSADAFEMPAPSA